MHLVANPGQRFWFCVRLMSILSSGTLYYRGTDICLPDSVFDLLGCLFYDLWCQTVQRPELVVLAIPAIFRIVHAAGPTRVYLQSPCVQHRATLIDRQIRKLWYTWRRHVERSVAGSRGEVIRSEHTCQKNNIY